MMFQASKPQAHSETCVPFEHSDTQIHYLTIPRKPEDRPLRFGRFQVFSPSQILNWLKFFIADAVESLFKPNGARILARELAAFQQQYTDRIGHKPKCAVVTVPKLPEFLRDRNVLARAADTAGLRIETANHVGYAPQISCAYAGTGAGLCENYTDLYACEEEVYEGAREYVLAVSLEHRALRVVFSSGKSAYSLYENCFEIFWDLGFSSSIADGAEDPGSGYWQDVRNAIVKVARRASARPTSLLLMGDGAEQPGLVRAVEEAMQKIMEGPEFREMVVSSKGDYKPVMLPARGAAEFAKRDQEAPPGCTEIRECQERRRHVSQGTELLAQIHVPDDL